MATASVMEPTTCQRAKSAMAQNSQAWTNLNGGPCNDETPCTNNDMCVMGACVGSAVEDSYEHNDTKSTAVPLREAERRYELG